MKVLKKNKLIISLTLQLFTFICTYSQHNNAVNELTVKNGIITYFQHNINSNQLQGKDFFKPYLAYIDENQKPKDYLMDSFILIDQFYHFVPNVDNLAYDGIYKSQHLDLYLKNIFKRAFLPILKKKSNSNQSAILIDTKSSTLSNGALIDNDVDSLSLTFELKFGTEYMYDRNYQILIGWEFFDENDQKLITKENFELSFSEWYDFYFEILNINVDQKISHSITIPRDVKNQIHEVKFHIMNYDTNAVELEIDNVFLTSKNHHLIHLSDSTFDNDYDELETNWIFRKKYNTVENHYLFKDRNPIIQQINIAKSELNEIELPTTNIIPTLPDFDIDYYLNNNKIKLLLNEIQSFLSSINQYYKDWNEKKPNSGIVISGIYISDENINHEKAKKMLPVFDFLKNELDKYNWELYGSPYMNFTDNQSINSTYSKDIYPYFNILWQQPNVFYHHFSRGNIDRDLLLFASELINNNQLNVNIETNLPSSTETYGRVLDYFTYGKKYGFINYSKIYYDEAGAYYLNSKSKNPEFRMIYDKLYEFIDKARYGSLINGNFESYDQNKKLYGWEGNYTFTNNGLNKILDNSYKIQINANEKSETEFIFLSENEEYFLDFGENNSRIPNIIIKLYDKQGKALKSIEVNDQKENKNFIYSFLTEKNVSGMTIEINNPSQNEIELDKISLYSKNNKKRKWLYSDKLNKNIIRSTTTTEFGNYSLLLDFSQNIKTKNKIPIYNNEEYLLSISYKESLPLKKNQQPKAYLGIETYDENGTKVITKLSDKFHYHQELEMHVIEIDNFNSTWTEFTEKIKFSERIKSVNIHIINNHYNNQLAFDNLSLIHIKDKKTDKNEQNLLNNNLWTDLLPIYITGQTPSFYKEFIAVNEYQTLKFSALVKTDSFSLSKDFLKIHCYDNTLQHIPFYDLNFLTNFENLNKPNSKYWDESNSEYYKNKNVSHQKWFNNKWKIYEKVIQLPKNTAYISISMNVDQSSNSMISILSPNLEIVD